jgi:hypothetical protein
MLTLAVELSGISDVFELIAQMTCFRITNLFICRSFWGSSQAIQSYIDNFAHESADA